MATYLITGISGFIGSSLARAILAQGDRVRGIDNFATGRRENIEEIRTEIDFHESDLLDLDAMKIACRGVDFVLHEAAIPSVPKSVLDPFGSNQANVDGIVNILIAVRDAKVKRVVYAASSSSYGLETVCLRYFNIFGPRQDPTSPYSGVLAKFITSMLNGEQPTIFGDGSQSRDFTYIDNVVSANLLACKAPAPAVGQVFNVATGHRIDLNETFRVLKQLTGYQGQVKYEAERAGDVKHSLADISKAEKYLGYRPLVHFQEGLQKTVEWYRTHLKLTGATA